MRQVRYSGVHLSQLRLRDFRNYGRLDIEFSPGVQLLLGDNAQGKTSILEAIYLMATLRSFRGAASAEMVRHQQSGYFVGGNVVAQGSHSIRMFWSSRERNLTLNEEPVKKLSDYFGVLRVVIFCTEDLHLINGTGRVRRRFLDLLLAQSKPTYLQLLQRYSRAVRSRNAILKNPRPDANLLASFTREVVQLGEKIIAFRLELIPKISPLARLAYRKITNDREELRLDYAPSVESNFEAELALLADRERRYGSTLIGPHRDDLKLLVNNKPAAQFASEGQKRSLAIALKIAQAEYLSGLHGVPPILLIDDVMGELDASRRSAFLPLLSRTRSKQGQVFMTCTAENWPRELAKDWAHWSVTDGAIARVQPTHP